MKTRQRKIFLIIATALFFLFHSLDATAFWIWTPKSKKLVNPKYAAKDSPQEQYRWAMTLFEEKDYKRAAEEFSRLTEHFSDSTLAPEAQYYAGRSYETLGKPYPAFLAYQKVIDVYPFTKRIDEIIEREFNLGKRIYKIHSGKLMGKELMTDMDRAVEVFRKVKENAPFGEYADMAQYMVGECYKKSEFYDDAVREYQALIDEYPRSALLDKAQYEVAQCTFLASLKPDYDQKLTDQAIKEFKKLADDRDEYSISEQAREAISMLEDRKAESIYKTAQFYEKQKRYKAAAIYYNEIMSKYPRSSFKEPALKRLEKIAERLWKKQ